MTEAKLEISYRIAYSNAERRHSSPDYQFPMKFELVAIAKWPGVDGGSTCSDEYGFPKLAGNAAGPGYAHFLGLCGKYAWERISFISQGNYSIAMTDIPLFVVQIQSCLSGFDEKQMYQAMLRHYKILHLISEDGQWSSPELQAIGPYLLPENITEEHSKGQVQRMAEIALQNPYLANFFKAAANEQFSTLSLKMATEGQQVIPEVISWSLVLERMTTAMCDNPAITWHCVATFKQLRKNNRLFKGIPLFYRVKALSVEYPLTNAYLKSFETGVVAPDAGKWSLPINILEATLTDCLRGMRSNAKAGWTLARNGPGRRGAPQTGALPSAWSDDKKVPCRFAPLPTDWANLYQTWNMAFVSHFPDFPYIIPKLFIPRVANYQKNPGHYPYVRITALYLTLFHYGLNKLDRKTNHKPEINWYDEKLTKLWGANNEASANKYKESVAIKKHTIYK